MSLDKDTSWLMWQFSIWWDILGSSRKAGRFLWDHSQWHLFRVGVTLFMGLRDRIEQMDRRFIPRGQGGGSTQGRDTG